MHALVVGGSGMLRDATIALTRFYDTVSLVARRPSSVPGVQPLPVDYHDSEGLRDVIRSAVALYGPLSLAVCWIHSSAPDALRVVSEELGRSDEPCRLFRVQGSAAADPTRMAQSIPDWLPPTLQYRQVILGFQIEGGRSRWLTHPEISQGVLQAIAQDAESNVVGLVRPWEMRP